MAAPIEKLAGEEQAPFSEEFHRSFYADLIEAATDNGVASAQLPGVTVEVELREAA